MASVSVFPKTAAAQVPEHVRGLNNMATDFISEQMYCHDTRLGRHVFDVLRRMSFSDPLGVHTYLKGGLALHTQIDQVLGHLENDRRVRSVDELRRLADKYFKISDLDSSVMIRAHTRGEFHRKASQVSARWIRTMRNVSATMAPLFDSVQTRRVLTAYFSAKKQEILDLLGISEPAGDLLIRARFQKHSNLSISDTLDRRNVACVRSRNRSFLFVSSNRTPSYVDSTTGAVRAFWLLRVKCSIRLTIVSRFDPAQVIATRNVAGEVIDVSIPLFHDAGRIAFFAQNHQHHIRTVTPIIAGRLFPSVPCGDLQYCLDDLRISMADFATPAKNAKRQMRYALLRKIKETVIRIENETAPFIEDPVAYFFDMAHDRFGSLDQSSYLPLTSYTQDFLNDYQSLRDLRVFIRGGYMRRATWASIVGAFTS